jgi:uncharacterized protein
MRVAVLSDTHIPTVRPDIPDEVYAGISGVDMILHAGDIVELPFLDKLAKIAPVRAVCGNMDNDYACSQLPKKDIVKIEGVSIGLIHGWGPPAALVSLVGREFKNVDAIIFGHSHTPLMQDKDGILFFNPGSPTDRIFSPYNSYGILEIEGRVIKPQIIKI